MIRDRPFQLQVERFVDHTHSCTEFLPDAVLRDGLPDHTALAETMA